MANEVQSFHLARNVSVPLHRLCVVCVRVFACFVFFYFALWHSILTNVIHYICQSQYCILEMDFQ